MAGRLQRIAQKALAVAVVMGCLTAGGAIGSLLADRSPSPPPVARTPQTPEGLPHYMADPKGAAERVKEMARRTRGNYEALTERERNWINGMTAGYGHELLRNQARLLGIKPEGPPPHDRGRRARSSSGNTQNGAPSPAP